MACKSQYLHFIRQEKKIVSVPLIMGIDLFEDRDEDTTQIKMLYNRISRLKHFDRAIVLLWLENFSYEEIAAIVGISVKNVSVRLFRIKEELKKCLTTRKYMGMEEYIDTIELKQMKEQIAILNSKLDAEVVVNEKLLRKVIKNKVSGMNRYVGIMNSLALLLIPFLFGHVLIWEYHGGFVVCFVCSCL